MLMRYAPQEEEAAKVAADRQALTHASLQLATLYNSWHDARDIALSTEVSLPAARACGHAAVLRCRDVDADCCSCALIPCSNCLMAPTTHTHTSGAGLLGCAAGVPRRVP